MIVKLIGLTPAPEKLIASAARICYDSKPNSPEADERLVGNLRDWGHFSTYEHASATFLLEGISRACTHQLVRHRLASYNQQSQRYVNESNFDYVIPGSVEGKEEALGLYKDFMESARDVYGKLIDAGIPKEDARFVLPNATTSKIIVTMNFRELRHFIKLRMGKDAQWEIRDLAAKMLDVIRKEAPTVFGDF
ncbi:FAD-dependent thymidylate synthase [Candidatus Altiarchaeota archaeon]